MITIYKPPRRKSEESSPSPEFDSPIPAGTPYFTKVNGKLVMARSKRKDTATDIAIDLLGEAFGGPRTTIIRKRAKSVDQQTTPLLVPGAPNMTQQPVPYGVPMPQYAFPTQGVPQPMPMAMLQTPQYPNQPPTFVPSPTEKDLSQLKRIDAHFNKLLAKQTSRESMGHKERLVEKVTEVKTTITITKHVCANCGRLRSKKYHHDHPMKAGEQPAPAFCKKCQRDASSTSCSDRSSTIKEKKKKSKTNSKSKKYHHKKPVESSSEDDSSDTRAPKAKAKQNQQASKKKEPKRKSSEDDYVIVEEEIIERENIRPRGRPRERSVVVEREYDYERRPPSPINVQTARHRSQSVVTVDRHKIPRKPVRPPKAAEIREAVRERSPPIQYRYVDASAGRQNVEPREEAQLRAEQVEIREESYPKKIPVRFEEDIVYQTVEAPRAYHRDQEMPPRRGSPSMEYSVEEPESAVKGFPARDHRLEERSLTPWQTIPRKPLSKQSSFEDREMESSKRSVEARQRRRRERNSPTSPSSPPWEQPHVIHPRDGDEVIVVTERYEYRPKEKPEVAEEERRTQEYVDRAAFYVRPDYPESRLQSQAEPGYFSHEEAAKYYHDDWSRAEPGWDQRNREPQRRYCRERHQDSELGDSEASYDHRTRAYVNIPRAPTPPSSFEASLVDSWQDPQEGPPYPFSSGSEGAATRNKTRAAAGQGPILSNPSNERGKHPHAYVREATDGGTERALVPSPRNSRSWSRGTGTYDDQFSDMTEKERIAERHVTFRETPSEREWTGTNESYNGMTEMRGHDLSTGGGSGW